MSTERDPDEITGFDGAARRQPGVSGSVDRIELTGLRVVGVVGVLPEERERAQPFEVDLVIEADLRAAGEHDDLAATVDYGPPLALVERVIVEERHLLLERVAARILEEVLALPGVEGAEVVVRKLRPPVPHDLTATAVRLARSRLPEPSPAVRAYLGLGSNLGDRRAYLAGAVAGLSRAGVVSAVSGVYETDPVGGPAEQGPFLNLVVQLDTRLDPFALLRCCQRLERDARRVRDVHWGPRTLDVDVLLYGDAEIRSALLTVPHPRLAERRFVLAPLADLAPQRCPPGWDASLPAGGVRRVEDLEPA